jgi:pyrroline-5-carboxylate reductase
MSELSGKKLGFLGAGMMAEAIIRGLIGQGKIKADQACALESRCNVMSLPML